ncbi:MAG: oligosaccharide flippase family protein [Anaerolineales bacterium]|nr:oligosaccharide flippase family protein [Anaerolineales bacterium]
MAPGTDPQIAGKVVHGSLISGVSSVVTIGLGFVRTILLTIFLLPDDVGVVTQALFFVTLAAQIRMPGIDRALIQREDTPAGFFETYFTLRTALVLVSIGIMAGLTPFIAPFYPDMPLLALILIAFLLIEIPKAFNEVQEIINRRNLSFGAIAQADMASAVFSTIAAPLLAWLGLGSWSLVGERVAAQAARGAVFWLLGKPQRLRVGFDKQIARWFWNFGIKVWAGGTLTFVLDRFDDFWVGLTLGQSPLGLYSRAYEFARYPRSVVGVPVLSVFYATFARLQADRLRLSKAFFRAAGVIVRVGFLFSLLFILTAPEFIQLLGEQWLPMQTTFQLMVVYTLLDPLGMAAGRLLTAVNHPELTARSRGIQLLIFVPAVILLNWWQGIVGVAIAADIMAAVGIVFLFHHTRKFVDYSMRVLFFWPTVALVGTAVPVLLLTPTWQQLNPWLALPLKLLLIFLLYVTILWLTEREQLKSIWQIIWNLAQPSLARFRHRGD